MLSLAERYIFRRVLTLSLMTLTATTVIVLITQVLIYVNVVTDSGEAFLTFFKLALMLVPAMVNIAMPFALLIGATQTLNTMHSDSEIVVLEAAGASGAVVSRPILIVAAGMALATLGNSLWLEPLANRELRNTINAAGSNLVQFAVRSGSFHRIEDNLYLQIAGQAPSGEFQDLMIADMRDPASELIYFAQRGSIQSEGDLNILLMRNGEIQRKNTQSGEISIIAFQTYALDFTDFGASSGTANYFPKERETAYLLNPPASDGLATRRPELIRAELHRRFSEWLFPLAFGVIAAFYSAGARSNRQERLWITAAAVGVALAFRGLGFLALSSAGNSRLLGFTPYLVPLSAIALFTTLMLMGVRAYIPQGFMDRLQNAFTYVQTRMGLAPKLEDAK
jgi:lipopolysaccharide export system permease protein